MKTKNWYTSKELWLALGVIVNSVFTGFGLPAIPMTPEVVGAIGVIFFTLRAWFTEAKLV